MSADHARHEGLGRILAFTITAADVESAAAAYVDWLGYSIEETGRVSPQLASHWGAPAMVGRRWARLRPPGDAEITVRLVEQAAVPGAPLLSHGWNAMEVLVVDPYELARTFEASPFRVVVPPRPLPFDPGLHAMQVIGPAGELLYFTSLPTDREVFDLTPARHRVDRPFIAILGGPDMSAMLGFYAQELHTRVLPASRVNVRIVNDTFGLPADARIPLGIVKLPRDYLIEVDEYPVQSRPRARREGELPGGIAMVSFAYSGAPGLVVGAAGEWLELVSPI